MSNPSPYSHVFWVDVLYCPKDNSYDNVPPFSKHSRFPLQQFLIGLHDGIWPRGMKVRVNWLARTGEKHSNGQAVKVEQKREYVIGKVIAQRVMMDKIEGDSREFLTRCGRYERRRDDTSERV